MTQNSAIEDNLLAIQRETAAQQDALQRGVANDSVPVGTIMMFGGSVPPPGYAICDGSPLSRTMYAQLFGVLGTRYGVGDGSTTFNIPNIQNRIPLGMYPGTPPGSALGQTGGEENHTLTTAEMPAHIHSEIASHYHVTGQYPTNPYFQTSAAEYAYFTTGSSNTGAYQGSIATTGGAGTGAYVYITPTDNPAGTGNTGLATLTGPQNATTNVSSTGGGATHNNMPPYITLNFIIALGVAV